MRGEMEVRMAGPVIVDVPMRLLKGMPEVERCVHLRGNGLRCDRARQERQERCDIHYEWYMSPAAAMGLQFPEDVISLQRFLAKITGMILTGKIGHKASRSMVELCKMVANNVRAYEMECEEAARRQ